MDKSRFFLPTSSAILCEHKKTVPGTLPYVQPYYHQHDGYEIYLFLNGNVTYYIEHHCARLEKGSLFFTCPGELHRVECNGEVPYERITINIRPSVLTALSTESSDLGQCFHTSDGGLDNIILLNKQTMNFFFWPASFNIIYVWNPESTGAILWSTAISHRFCTA